MLFAYNLVPKTLAAKHNMIALQIGGVLCYQASKGESFLATLSSDRNPMYAGVGRDCWTPRVWKTDSDELTAS